MSAVEFACFRVETTIFVFGPTADPVLRFVIRCPSAEPYCFVPHYLGASAGIRAFCERAASGFGCGEQLD